MSSIERVHPTKRGSGIVVVGRANAEAESVFDDLSRELSHFYFELGLILVTYHYDQYERRYNLPVYDPDNLDVRIRMVRREEDPRAIIGLETIIQPPTALGSVSIQPLPSQTYHRYVKGWDFAHAPHETTYERLLAYFNMNEREGESADDYNAGLRDDFCRLLKSKMSRR